VEVEYWRVIGIGLFPPAGEWGVYICASPASRRRLVFSNAENLAPQRVP